MPPVLFAVLLLLAVGDAQPRPKLKFGLTLSKCGLSAQISIGQAQALRWYANYTNENGGVNINNTIHDLEFIIYNDAFDGELMTLLYEKLILEDNVDVLMAPLGDGRNAYTVAQKYGRIIMNGGDFTYYAGLNAPNGTFNGSLFSAVPNILTLPYQCYNVLKTKGVQSLSSAWPENVATNSFDLISLLGAAQYDIAVIPPTATILDDLSNLDDAIDALIAQKADFFSGTMLSPDASHTVVNRMFEKGYIPKAFVVWIGPGFSTFRDAAPWQSAGMLFPDAWNPSLNFSDYFFGDSQGYYDAYLKGVQRTPDVTDTVAIYAAHTLRIAIETARSTNQEAIKQALLNMNTETFFGFANFTSAPLQQTNAPYYCFQVAEDGRTVYPVSPNAQSARAVTYPVEVNFPPGFRESSSNKRKWLALGLGLGLGLLAVAVLAVIAYIIVIRYQVVFIPKSEDKGEW